MDYGGALSSGIETVGAFGLSAFNNSLAKERAKEDRYENYMYGEMAANSADQRTRKLYADLYSPQAKVQQLIDAGMSPSVALANGNAMNAGGSTAGAQGSGAAGIKSDTYGIDPLTFAQIGLMNAQANEAQSNADVNNGENELGTAKIAETYANAGYKTESANLTKLQADAQKINNAIATATQEADILKACEEAKKATYEAVEAFEKARQAGFKSEFDETTLRTRINQVTADYEWTLTQKELTEEQSKIIEKNYKLAAEQLALEWQKAEIYDKSVEYQKTWWDNQNKLLQDQLRNNKEIANIYADVQRDNAWINAGAHVITGIGQAAVFGLLKTPQVQLKGGSYNTYGTDNWWNTSNTAGKGKK